MSGIQETMEGVSENPTGAASNSNEEEYPMTHNPRGKAIIFKHYKYNSILKLPKRVGTDVDKARLKDIFEKLKFETEICDDLTLAEIQEKLTEVSEADHTDFDCLVVVVMTHGTELVIEEEKLTRLYAFDQEYHETELWKQFVGNSCRTLRGKPKLFFIQACRGQEKGKGFLLQPGKAQRENMDRDYVQYAITNNADLLVAHSTSKGWYSYKKSTTGSIFMQMLCDELEADLGKENEAKIDLHRILTKVNRKVSQMDIDDGDDEDIKQMSWVESSLTKEVYFRDVSD